MGFKRILPTIISLGVDEHYAGKNLYVLSITNLTTHKPITFLPSDRVFLFKQFLVNVPDKVKENIKEVYLDMSEGLINAVKEDLPKAKS